MENAPPKTKTKPRYVPNKQGSDQLIDEQNFLYHVNTPKGCRVFWECSEKRTLGCHCNGVVFKMEIDGVVVEYVTYSGEHCHLFSIAKIKANEMDRQTVRDALANMAAPPSRCHLILAVKFYYFETCLEVHKAC